MDEAKQNLAQTLRDYGFTETWVERMIQEPTDGMPLAQFNGDEQFSLVCWHCWKLTPEGHDFWSDINIDIAYHGIEIAMKCLGTYEEAYKNWQAFNYV